MFYFSFSLLVSTLCVLCIYMHVYALYVVTFSLLSSWGPLVKYRLFSHFLTIFVSYVIPRNSSLLQEFLYNPSYVFLLAFVLWNIHNFQKAYVGCTKVLQLLYHSSLNFSHNSFYKYSIVMGVVLNLACLIF